MLNGSEVGIKKKREREREKQSFVPSPISYTMPT